ncbi:hypothetical protein Molly5_115 [Maribacter phage Molly_5]|uniref:Uncharacterized protein n=2 Tax=Mollyvirus TaxID=2948826 RepID=A0A8E4UXU1_9CAUD|nr:hypothetical protein M1M29_gp114 [Maribacter phage Molly_1]YP_010357361.1 hypothetical protein M1M30_gp112 [Maribacter phage Colly_1]QQO97605.1 hypothetical protein Molly2_114 [Maribacter phage Molly_2]QQO97805.1 hypothetical protein Molly3_114 [Maribacter phage Molly_3]QQO98006.1 hypothetical protein Molly4_115 [Maribacter phage Molly_4]QQO98206.1 hypothetical protein Molly5_115 [Maribacter phage Molly_5]QQO97210.1 hypothetical protein Colly1_112 [Maribacter phage Colly_1]
MKIAIIGNTLPAIALAEILSRSDENEIHFFNTSYGFNFKAPSVSDITLEPLAEERFSRMYSGISYKEFNLRDTNKTDRFSWFKPATVSEVNLVTFNFKNIITSIFSKYRDYASINGLLVNKVESKHKTVMNVENIANSLAMRVNPNITYKTYNYFEDEVEFTYVFNFSIHNMDLAESEVDYLYEDEFEHNRIISNADFYYKGQLMSTLTDKVYSSSPTPTGKRVVRFKNRIYRASRHLSNEIYVGVHTLKAFPSYIYHIADFIYKGDIPKSRQSISNELFRNLNSKL